MQIKLKSVLKYLSNVYFILLFQCILEGQIVYELKNNTFRIFDKKTVVYSDFSNFLTGSCNNIELLKGNFGNQFYIYFENSCTTKTIKQLYKLNWKENKFKLLCKEYFEIDNDKVNSKITYYDNYILDSLNLLDLSEDLKNKKTNVVDVYFYNKKIGNKKLTKVKISSYPQIDVYDTLDQNNLKMYNDIAYILFLNKEYAESTFLLAKIIVRFPKRVVAFLNIADCYWELKESTKAIEHYKKYIELMTEQKKDLNKIPKYVYDRIKK